MAFAGPDERLGHGVGGRGRLLPRFERDGLGGQRRERAPLHEAPGSDNAEEHSWHQEPARDPQWSREHFKFHAGKMDLDLDFWIKEGPANVSTLQTTTVRPASPPMSASVQRN